jgi:predicted kinase
MRTVYILKGLPASAKSSFARDLMKREPGRWVRVNRDDLRAMFHNSVYSQDNEEFVRGIQDQLILRALRDGMDVIVDNTHLVSQTLRKLHRLLASFGDVKVIEKAFNISIAEAKRRNALREGTARVPDHVIDGMARGAGIDRGRVLEDKEFYYPALEQQVKKYKAGKDLPVAVICDLDGTLALLNGRNPFDASKCDRDLPNTPVIECVKSMHAAGHAIIFMSGREDKYREPTERFIAEHLPGIPYELHMRSSNDGRKDAIVKGELFDAHVAEKYNVLFVLDDRNQVVDFWRSIGLTVFQVAEGNF